MSGPASGASPPGRDPSPGRAWSRGLLFVVLGLVGAFAVSAVAGLWDDESAETGLQALGRDVDTPADVRIEVLNGAGTGGLARNATHRLRDAGFDVVFFGNAPRFDHDRSLVVDRVGDVERARAVARALGIDSVTSAVDSSLMLEVTVILGRDWPPEPVPEEDWLDRVRELLPSDSVADGDSASPEPADGAAAAPTPDPVRDSSG